ncbi:hypothetical protein R5M92_10955 [Halomonas sp. Bachu 37]|uniref:hypothetical protein n=1 Tax=Halomonas kashgarensis TaxID=3084920 RepID=UPI003217DDAB
MTLPSPGDGYATAPANAANPRANNEAGHIIIRWRESQLIQRPGNWSAGANAPIQDATVAASGPVRPRAATVVIQKRDGGTIGV